MLQQVLLLFHHPLKVLGQMLQQVLMHTSPSVEGARQSRLPGNLGWQLAPVPAQMPLQVRCACSRSLGLSSWRWRRRRCHCKVRCWSLC